MGRKKIDIDWKLVDEKLAGFWEGTEIAALLGISYATLERAIKDKFKVAFVDYKAQKRATGKGGLRALQMEIAKGKGKMLPNPSMAMFLGKNYLDQSDKQIIDHNITPTKPIEIKIVRNGKNNNT